MKIYPLFLLFCLLCSYACAGDDDFKHIQLPKYPRASFYRYETGTVKLQIYALSDGCVSSASIYSSSGYTRLDNSALTASRRWIFHKRHANSRVIVPVRFEIAD
ncbi:MAG: energy transducer TonB [Azoarcus sp.]|jgi:protein TonB|nr:energy transducer TonB [Azoarcus sp.]